MPTGREEESCKTEVVQESREEGRKGRKEGKRKGSDEGWEAPNILGLKVAVQLPKNSSSSSFSAKTCCDCTGWNEKIVKGEERRGMGEESEGKKRGGDGVWSATNIDM